MNSPQHKVFSGLLQVLLWIKPCYKL